MKRAVMACVALVVLGVNAGCMCPGPTTDYCNSNYYLPCGSQPCFYRVRMGSAFSGTTFPTTRVQSITTPVSPAPTPATPRMPADGSIDMDEAPPVEPPSDVPAETRRPRAMPTPQRTYRR